MGKISGSYESVVRGVSEQAAQNRRSGQHTAQVNMISDPVRGLARRHGSIIQDEQLTAIPANKFPDVLADTEGHKTFPFYVGGDEFDLIYRTGADTRNLGKTGFAWAFNKITHKFLPIVYGPNDVGVDALVSGGVSAAVNIGRYVYLAGNTLTPAVSASPLWDNATNLGRIAATIQLGAYSRRFSITLVRQNGTMVVGEYTTPSSGYPGTLDTSDIPLYVNGQIDPEYQKKVNDRVNAYTSAQINWVTTSAQAITPANIANQLAASLRANGAPTAGTVGGTVIVEDVQFVAASGTDGGDGSLIRVVGADIDNVDLINTTHYVGKVVRVPANTSGGNAVYLKAVPRDDERTTGWASVIWRETAGYQITPTSVFVMGTIQNGTLYLSSRADVLGTLTGLAVPTYKPNTVGDDISSPIPEFVGKTIDYLGVFQDRLVIGSGSTLLFSRPGDYLNWFRKSVTTVVDDDPWEGFALGTEDDTIKWSTLYDRNLLLFGKRFQYVVSGRQPFTPKTASIIVSTAFEDAVDSEPKATGNFVIYSKYSGRQGSEISSIHQVQAGSIADAPESYKISQQLDTYLTGVPSEIVPLTAPNMVLLRTRKERYRVFTYSYLDDPQQGRLFDSWSDWRWSDKVGALVGLSRESGDVLIYTIKLGSLGVYVACERMVRDTALSDYPYLDSLRPLAQFKAATTAFLRPTGPTDDVAVAIERLSEKQFIGLEIDRLNDFEQSYSAYADQAWVGVAYDSYVTPTNPFIKDRNNQPILTGRLTLGSVKVAVDETGGMQATVTRFGTEIQVLNFNGRLLADPSSLIGQQPIVSTTLSVVVGGEIRNCSYTLHAKTWLPLTITSMDWVGQHFFNTRRA